MRSYFLVQDIHNYYTKYIKDASKTEKIYEE